MTRKGPNLGPSLLTRKEFYPIVNSSSVLLDQNLPTVQRSFWPFCYFMIIFFKHSTSVKFKDQIYTMDILIVICEYYKNQRYRITSKLAGQRGTSK